MKPEDFLAEHLMQLTDEVELLTERVDKVDTALAKQSHPKEPKDLQPSVQFLLGMNKPGLFIIHT